MTDTAEQDTTVDDDEMLEESPPSSADDVNNTNSTEQTEEEPETFPRKVVEDLRRESAGYRDKAKRTDELAAALWHARVEASGKLADPTDLPLPEDTDPTDPEAVTAAVDELLQRKPHLAARTPRGDVGQGQAGGGSTVDLAEILRSRA